jgi:predicted branched-subunit amino acid permease
MFSRTEWAAMVRHPEFRRGAQDMVGVALGIAAWGLVTGVAMVKGLGVVLALLMSLFVFAGSAQLASLPLIASGAPLWLVWATAICVNLRFIIFSAQWRPYFAHLPLRQRGLLSYFCADLNFVLFTRRFPEARPQEGQLSYFWGGVMVNAGAWHVASLLGIALAQRVPEQWGLGFAGTLALLGFTYSLLTDRGTIIAAVIASGAAVAAYALPLKLNIVIAIAAAVVVGVVLDHLKPPAPRRPARPVGDTAEDLT